MATQDIAILLLLSFCYYYDCYDDDDDDVVLAVDVLLGSKHILYIGIYYSNVNLL